MCKKTSKLSVAVLFVMAIALSFSGCADKDGTSYMLEMEYTENFKIMQLADVQVSTVKECDDAFAEIEKLVAREKPNLIVSTGDNIYIPKGKKILEAFISHMESLETPWATVFGNHDQAWISKNFMAKRFMKAEHCLFLKGESNIHGVGNYVINLKSANNIVYSLFMIDSNMYAAGGGYTGIRPNQIKWYERAVNKLTELNNNQVVPSLAFFHIPLHEFADAKASLDAGESTGFAIFNEEVGAAKKNTGFFNKALELNSTKAIICGHDHKNNCDINYKGIHLVYGLKSSRCDYHDSALLGATMITLTSAGFVVENACFE